MGWWALGNGAVACCPQVGEKAQRHTMNGHHGMWEGMAQVGGGTLATA